MNKKLCKSETSMSMSGFAELLGEDTQKAQEAK